MLSWQEHAAILRAVIAGFRAEGIARGNAFQGGVYRDELIMALLRPEWQAGQR